jgi:hypothetical protein
VGQGANGSALTTLGAIAAGTTALVEFTSLQGEGARWYLVMVCWISPSSLPFTWSSLHHRVGVDRFMKTITFVLTLGLTAPSTGWADSASSEKERGEDEIVAGGVLATLSTIGVAVGTILFALDSCNMCEGSSLAWAPVIAFPIAAAESVAAVPLLITGIIRFTHAKRLLGLAAVTPAVGGFVWRF